MKKKYYNLTDGYYSNTTLDLPNLMELLKVSIEEAGEDGYNPEIVPVLMTEEEFNNLPDYNG